MSLIYRCGFLLIATFLLSSWAIANNDLAAYSPGTQQDYPSHFPVVDKSKQLDALIAIRDQNQGAYAMMGDGDTVCLMARYAGILYPRVIQGLWVGLTLYYGFFLTMTAEWSEKALTALVLSISWILPGYLAYCTQRVKSYPEGVSLDKADKYKTFFIPDNKTGYVPDRTFFTVEQPGNTQNESFLIMPYGHGLHSPLPRCLTNHWNQTAPIIMDCAFERGTDNRKIMATSQLWTLSTVGELLPLNQTSLKQIGLAPPSLHIDIIYEGKKVRRIGEQTFTNIEFISLRNRLERLSYERHLLKKDN